jgi:hypothetical protein
VHDTADLVHGHHLQHVDLPRLGVDLHLHEVGGKGVRLGRRVGALPHDVRRGQAAAGQHRVAHGDRAIGSGHAHDAGAHVEVAGGGLELVGGALQQLAPRLGRRQLGGHAAHVGGVACEGANVPRHDVGVAVHHVHRFERQPEFLGDDLRQRRVGAGAEARRTGVERGRAVLVDLDVARCLAP